MKPLAEFLAGCVDLEVVPIADVPKMTPDWQKENKVRQLIELPRAGKALLVKYRRKCVE